MRNTMAQCKAIEDDRQEMLKALDDEYQAGLSRMLLKIRG